jgi:NADH:ubiquinone oxidoreductase subunit 6 (subunit J)
VEIIQITGSIERISQNITAISNSLFGEYLVPFELISLILVGGIIGMLYISGREE